MFQNFLHTDYGSGAVYWAVRVGEWKWEGVEVGGCGGGRVWRWEGVQMGGSGGGREWEE